MIVVELSPWSLGKQSNYQQRCSIFREIFQLAKKTGVVRVVAIFFRTLRLFFGNFVHRRTSQNNENNFSSFVFFYRLSFGYSEYLNFVLCKLI